METNINFHKILNKAYFNTPIGDMISIADDNLLYLLEFIDRPGLELEISKLIKTTRSEILLGSTAIIRLIELELKQYFNGTLKQFSTPLFLMGTLFQQSVWNELLKIQLGQTASYANLAKSINKPTACRAVARANASNQLAIIIPCHRIINSSGVLGGYAGGIKRKEWLLNHEKQHI